MKASEKIFQPRAQLWQFAKMALWISVVMAGTAALRAYVGAGRPADSADTATQSPGAPSLD